jgi:hypothetical protein
MFSNSFTIWRWPHSQIILLTNSMWSCRKYLFMTSTKVHCSLKWPISLWMVFIINSLSLGLSTTKFWNINMSLCKYYITLQFTYLFLWKHNFDHLDHHYSTISYNSHLSICLGIFVSKDFPSHILVHMFNLPTHFLINHLLNFYIICS